MCRAKRHSAEGWKYVNDDGSLWPKDRWIPYSKKHPPPRVDADPAAPRAKVPLDQYGYKETGAFYAYVVPISPAAYQLKTDGQTVLTKYFGRVESARENK